MDKLDLSGVSTSLVFQSAQLSGSTIQPNTIDWQRSGGNTFVYVNTSGSTESLGGANMMIEQTGNLTLTSKNVVA